MSNSIGNLFVISIILICIACYLLDAKKLLKNTVIKTLVKKVLPKATSKEYKKLNSMLTKSSLNFSVLEFYIIKIGVFLTAAVFAFLIFITNTQIKQNQIFATPIYSNYSNNDFRNSNKIRLKNFKILKQHIDVTKISGSSNDLENVKKVLLTFSDVSSENLDDSSYVLLKDTIAIKPLYVFSRKIKYMLYVLLFFMVPDFILYIYSIIIVKRKTEELNSLTNLIIIISSNPNVTSRNILDALIENSNYLKPYLQKFKTNYLINRNETYSEFLNQSKYKPILKLVSVLRQIEESDTKSTIYNLENNNSNIEKSRKITFENILEKKDGIMLILFSIGACMLLKIAFDVAVTAISNMGNPGL
ncbi:MAG: hypothetical protein LKF87_11065 [Clostridium tyrobutyricum]|jgi:hypothetical protein|uniref:hypothetical protein n=1 Tax=Clostridium tyrobutyricum TaxID=1519 RepID=UPI0011C71DB3|nr:hypothetical protein [Clostridium tyrobutyricum]MCH4236500.1 hypothetical protein [Clostridium tyrobutyricum]MCH4259480.1 hypothetical protein [Clostridium tyrobutyricum]